MLSESRINQIELKSQEVLSSINTITILKPPTPVEEILKTYTIQLKSGDFEDSSISGAYDKKIRTIFVERKEPYLRKAFIIAHELGHFFLHEEKQAEFFYRSQIINIDEETSPVEEEANVFATSLLMPKKLVKEFWELTGDPEQLSIIFGVSPSVVYYQLKILHII